LSPARRAAFCMGLSSENGWMDKELSDWLIQEDHALKALRPLALAELLRLAAEDPTRMKAFVEQVNLRMKAPLSQDLGGAEDASSEPALDQAFPGWEISWEKKAVVGEVSAQKNPLSQPQVWKAALLEGALGKLAVNVAKIYGLEAADGASLIGEAKRALMEEAGWTQGVWRLAANNPDFAELSADYLSAQVKAGQGSLRRHDQVVKNRERRRERLFGVAPVSSDEQKATLLIQRQESGAAMDRWFVEKRAELDASSSARALMAIGRTAVERGGLDEGFLAFAKFMSKAPSTSSNLDTRLSEPRRWVARILAGAGSCLTHSSEAAVLQALRDQEACQELTSQWAAAFAEGLGRARKLIQKEEKRKLSHFADGEENSPAAKKQENALAERAFRDSLELLMDCVSATPGFMQTLPKKLNWGFLMNAQERWHAQEQEREFSKSRDAHLAWEPVAAEFSEGFFSAVPLKNARDLFDEGKAMTHCVFNYTDRCHEGTTRIISIRQGERRVSTLELFPANAKGERLELDPAGKNAHEVAKWLRGQNNGPHNGAIRDHGILEFCDIYQEHLGEMAKVAREERTATKSLSGKAPSPKKETKKGASEKKAPRPAR